MDTDDFVRHVRTCEKKLYYTARCILPVEADCEDAVQAALFKAFRSLSTLREAKYFDTWLTRILINECVSISRKRARRREVALGDDERARDTSDDTRLRDALDGLHIKYRLPLVLHHIEGYDLDAVARMLILPKGAVKWRLERARKLMREALEKEAIS